MRKLPQINTTPYFYPVYDNDNPWEGTVSDGAAAPLYKTILRKLAKRKRGQPILSDLFTLPNEIITDPKKAKILELHQIIYNPIIQTFLGGKETYRIEELESAVQFLLLEGVENHFPKKVLEDIFKDYTPPELAELKEYIHPKLIDAICSYLNRTRSKKDISSILDTVQNFSKSMEPINKKYIPIKKFK